MQKPLESGLDALFKPQSMALIGASNKPGKMGNLFAHRLREGFSGDLVAVNPGENEVAGIKCYPSVAALPGAVDVMIALVPGTQLLHLLEDCPVGAARFLIAIPSGFAEMSDSGRTQQEKLVAVARTRGIRVLGPNSVGLMNCELGLNASMIPLLPPGGRGVACVTQSGGFGMALAMYAVDHGLALSKFCDVGNMADIEIETVLSYLDDDPSTAVIGLFLESVRDPTSFLANLEKVALRKPVVVASIGRSQAGMSTSRAHLGLEPNVGRIAEVLPACAFAAGTGLDLMDACKTLLWQQRPSGKRIAIITGTGGIGGELADLAVAEGLEIPTLSVALQAQLRRNLPAYASVANPIDLTPIWWQYPTIYPELMRLIDASGEIDLILVSITDVATTLPALAAAIAALNNDGLRSSLLVYWGSRAQDLEGMRALEQARVPCFSSTRTAARQAGILGNAAG
jgi:acyl-CoA synthetase (NDP forming)